MLMQCDEKPLFWPVGAFLVVMQMYPIFELFKNFRISKSLSHTLPVIENACKMAFIRENMCIAVILDSFCINNFETVFGRQFCFPKIVGANTFFLQDLPQMLIHLYFMKIYPSHKVPHGDITVLISLISSIFAIQISFFNVVASHPNEFDPRLLEIELKRKAEVRNRYQSLHMKEGIKEEKKRFEFKKSKSINIRTERNKLPDFITEEMADEHERESMKKVASKQGSSVFDIFKGNSPTAAEPKKEKFLGIKHQKTTIVKSNKGGKSPAAVSPNLKKVDENSKSKETSMLETDSNKEAFADSENLVINADLEAGDANKGDEDKSQEIHAQDENS